MARCQEPNIDHRKLNIVSHVGNSSCIVAKLAIVLYHHFCILAAAQTLSLAAAQSYSNLNLCKSLFCKVFSDHNTDFAIFWDFLILVIFWICCPKMGPKGPGRASIGSGEGLRFIWTKFQPKWAHLRPNRTLFVFQFSNNPFWTQKAPSPVWVQDLSLIHI